MADEKDTKATSASVAATATTPPPPETPSRRRSAAEGTDLRSVYAAAVAEMEQICKQWSRQEYNAGARAALNCMKKHLGGALGG